MKLCWVTDIHLNFIEIEARKKFYKKITDTDLDALLISGDITEAPTISECLLEMAEFIKKPIYFVLGNHDYYRATIDLVRQKITKLSKIEKLINWLPSTGPQILSEGIILLGQDGWADGRLGDFQNSPVSLVDSRLIADLFQEKILGKNQLLKKMQQLADNDAINLHKNIKEALKQDPNKILILTHVPPFKETSLYEGAISDDNYQPYFTSKATGDILMEVAIRYPLVEFLVFCGHTHHECTYKPLDNLLVRVGKAEYYYPELQDVIEFP